METQAEEEHQKYW